MPYFCGKSSKHFFKQTQHGVLRRGTVDQVSLEDLDLVLNVNVRGVFLAIQAAAAKMRDAGRIITIGSNTAIRTGFPGSSVYGMSKAAVARMVKGSRMS